MTTTMTMTTVLAAVAIEPSDALLVETRERAHPFCFACGSGVSNGLGLRFRVAGPDAVEAVWHCATAWVSYPAVIHGGLISTALDCAMLSVLFARGVHARTATLEVRFHHPIRPGADARVWGRWIAAHGPIYQLESTVYQGERLCARAKAKFMRPPT